MFDKIPEDKDTIYPVMTMVQIRCGHCGERFIIRDPEPYHDILKGRSGTMWSARCPFCIATNAIMVKVEERFIETRVERKKRIGTSIKDAIEDAEDRLRERP